MKEIKGFEMKTLRRGTPRLDALKGQCRAGHPSVVETTMITKKNFGHGGGEQNKDFYMWNKLSAKWRIKKRHR